MVHSTICNVLHSRVAIACKLVNNSLAEILVVITLAQKSQNNDSNLSAILE